MDPGILSIPGTWDYPGMSLVRVTGYTAWILESVLGLGPKAGAIGRVIPRLGFFQG